jgi:hypothetical protein
LGSEENPEDQLSGGPTMQQEMTMSHLTYPNESAEYRGARETRCLLKK